MPRFRGAAVSHIDSMCALYYNTDALTAQANLRGEIKMKKVVSTLAALLAVVMVLSVAGCGSKKAENSLVGTWEYTDKETGIGAVYVLNQDGTGTYTLKAGEEVTYELKYEAKDGHLLVTYVNNDAFSEDDVFDNEFSFQDANTLIIKDSFGEEMTFVKK